MKRTQTFLLTLAIASTAFSQNAPPARFQQLDRNTDGRLTRNEVPEAAAFSAADAGKDGAVTPEEFRRYVTTRPKSATPKPPLPAPTASIPAPAPVNAIPVPKQLPDSDAVRDAAGTVQLFECVPVPGITDVREGMNGFALADLNRDGRPDLVATFSPPQSHRSTRLAVLLIEGGFRFTPQAITIRDSALTMEDFGPAAQIPNLADFNGDGFLDMVITRALLRSADVSPLVQAERAMSLPPFQIIVASGFSMMFPASSMGGRTRSTRTSPPACTVTGSEMRNRDAVR